MGDVIKELTEAFGTSAGIINDSIKYVTKDLFLGDCAANTTVKSVCCIPRGKHTLRRVYYVFTDKTGTNTMNLNVYKDDGVTKMIATTNMTATAADAVAEVAAFTNADAKVVDGDFVVVSGAGADNASLTDVHVTLVFEKTEAASYGGG